MLHQSPRIYGKQTSVWTLALAACVCFEQGFTESVMSIETIRQALPRLGVGWQRAKPWITSPDPRYLKKKKTRCPHCASRAGLSCVHAVPQRDEPLPGEGGLCRRCPARSPYKSRCGTVPIKRHQCRRVSASRSPGEKQTLSIQLQSLPDTIRK